MFSGYIIYKNKTTNDKYTNSCIYIFQMYLLVQKHWYLRAPISYFDTYMKQINCVYMINYKLK